MTPLTIETSPPVARTTTTPKAHGSHPVGPNKNTHKRFPVEIRNVTKTFGSTTAVRDLSMKVRERTIFGFIGPNGSGKTTTLRLIMRICRPDEGAGLVRVLGCEDLRKPPQRVGYLPEERGLYNRMKVKDVLRFYAELKGCTNTGKPVRHWLDRMNLTAAANKHVEALSKGMAQKVQFIAAVINQPDLLILDEPFSGLDPVNADILRDVMLELKQQGTTIIYSTHDMHMAEKTCDDIVMIYNGDKVLDGTLENIKQNYGADSIRVRLDNTSSSLDDLPYVTDVTDFGRSQELRMQQDYDSQVVLEHLSRRGRILHFEVTTPSLHDIFVRIAGPKVQEVADA